MKLGKKYKVDSDSMNITLSKRVVSKKEKERWVVLGYFGNFHNLLKHLADNEIMGTGLEDLKLIAKRQKEVYDLISTIPQKL